MDKATRSLTFKAFGLLALAFAVEVLVLRAATIDAHSVQAQPMEPLARIEAPAAPGRQCTALDSFGNPVRPCRA